MSNSPITRIDPSGHSDSDYRDRMNRLRKAYGDKLWKERRRAYHRFGLEALSTYKNDDDGTNWLVFEGDPYWEFGEWTTNSDFGMGFDHYVITVSSKNINIEESLIPNPGNTTTVGNMGSGIFDPLEKMIPEFELIMITPNQESRIVKYQQNYKIINGNTGDIVETGVRTLDIRLQSRWINIAGTELLRVNWSLWKYPFRETNSPMPPLYP